MTRKKQIDYTQLVEAALAEHKTIESNFVPPAGEDNKVAWADLGERKSQILSPVKNMVFRQLFELTGRPVNIQSGDFTLVFRDEDTRGFEEAKTMLSEAGIDFYLVTSPRDEIFPGISVIGIDPAQKDFFKKLKDAVTTEQMVGSSR